MSIGTQIPNKRTAGGQSARKPSAKMARRRGQAKARARKRARGEAVRRLPSRRARQIELAREFNFNLAANVAPSSSSVMEAANTSRVIRRRKVYLEG